MLTIKSYIALKSCNKYYYRLLLGIILVYIHNVNNDKCRQSVNSFLSVIY